MIDQTVLIHEYITLCDNISFSATINPLEYNWFAVNNRSDRLIPADGVVLSFMDCQWLGLPEGTHHETANDQSADDCSVGAA